MEYEFYHSYSELYHHGILGMKWGVRRFQNKDGRYTEEGKKRRSERTKSNIPSVGSLKRTKAGVDIAKKTVNQLDKQVSKPRPKPRMDLSDMTDAELQKAITRENLERQYNQLFNAPSISEGQRKAHEILKISGDVLAVSGAVLSSALLIKQLKE